MFHYFEILVIIGSVGAFIFGIMKFMLRDIHKDLMDLKEGQNRLEIRLDKSETRIDNLYQICIEMLGTKHKH